MIYLLKRSYSNLIEVLILLVLTSFWYAHALGLPVEYIRMMLNIFLCLLLIVPVVIHIRILKLDYWTLGILVFAVMSLIVDPLNSIMSAVRVISFMCVYILSSNNVLVLRLRELMLLVTSLIVISFIIQYSQSDYQYVNGFSRYSGIYYMHSAGFALISLLVFLYLMLQWAAKDRNETKKLLEYAILIVVFIILFMTGSRSATLIALGGGFLYYSTKNKYNIVILVLLLSFVAAQVYTKISESGLLYRISGLLENGLSDPSSQNRLKFLAQGFGFVEGVRTVFGFGVGKFDDLYFANFGERIAPHFYLLQWYVEGGIIYLFFWIKFYLGIFNRITWSYKILMILYLVVASINNGEYYFGINILFLVIVTQRLNK